MVNITDFDLEELRVTEECYQPPRRIQQTVPPKSQRKGVTDWFIKGPLPGTWFEKAAKLSGHTLHVALAIWYVHGLSTATPTVLVERFHFDRLGVNKDATRRGLIQLKNAGLIAYSKVGHKFKVTILDNE